MKVKKGQLVVARMQDESPEQAIKKCRWISDVVLMWCVGGWRRRTMYANGWPSNAEEKRRRVQDSA